MRRYRLLRNPQLFWLKRHFAQGRGSRTAVRPQVPWPCLHQMALRCPHIQQRFEATAVRTGWIKGSGSVACATSARQRGIWKRRSTYGGRNSIFVGIGTYMFGSRSAGGMRADHPMRRRLLCRRLRDLCSWRLRFLIFILRRLHQARRRRTGWQALHQPRQHHRRQRRRQL